jgi:uncharacterized protein (DUF58 family)
MLPLIVPTRRFCWLVAAGLAPALLGSIAPGLEQLLWPYNLTLLALLLIDARRAGRAADLQIGRSHDPVLSVRVPNLIRLMVANTSGQRLVGRLREDPPKGADASESEQAFDLPSGQELEFLYHVTPGERGADFFGATLVRLRGPWGLCEVQSRVASESPVQVYPNVLALREFDLLNQRGRLSTMGMRRSRYRGVGSEFESLRDYQDDDYRRIDWKATARRGKLVVREHEQERNQAVIVCLDVGRRMLSEVEGVRKIDYALDACLMLLHAASIAGDQVGLLLFSDQVERFLPPRKGRGRSGEILDAVHAVSANPVESNYAAAFGYLSAHWKRRALIVVFTDAEDVGEASSLAAALRVVRARHLVMVVRVSDPRVRAGLDMRVRDEKELYQKAAFLWYAGERRQAEALLSDAGVDQIEADPEELSARLVSAYWRVKEAARL